MCKPEDMGGCRPIHNPCFLRLSIPSILSYSDYPHPRMPCMLALVLLVNLRCTTPTAGKLGRRTEARGSQHKLSEHIRPMRATSWARAAAAAATTSMVFERLCNQFGAICTSSPLKILQSRELLWSPIRMPRALLQRTFVFFCFPVGKKIVR